MGKYYTYSAIKIACVLLQEAKKQGKKFTNLQVQKLVYVCHGVSLSHFDRPLIIEDVHAWKYGPVVPAVYFQFKDYGSKVIDDFSEDNSDIDTESLEIIREITSQLGGYSGPQLIELTHGKGSPWHQVWSGNGLKIIPDEVIKAHYLGIKEKGIANCL